jgi:nucleoside-diphosphate-sugar epimerase
LDFVENRIQAESDLIQAAERFGFELSIGRLYTFSGKYLTQKKQYAISEFVSSASRSKIINVKGDPDTVRSYLHQEHMAKWIIKALICKEEHFDLQIGSNYSVTIRELAEYVAEETGSDITYSASPAPKDVYLPTNDETRFILGVEEGKNWKIAVNEMLDEVRGTHRGKF